MTDPSWTDEGHCVTLISDIAPDAVITALGATVITRVSGIDAVVTHTAERWEAGYRPDEAIIAVSDAGHGWAVIAEVNGYLGVTEAAMEPLSTGRTIVSHFRNVNSVSRFHWWRDGRLLLDVDLLFPQERLGAEPDALGDLDDLPTDLVTAGFTLAERVTGVNCIPELLEQAAFTIAVAAVPG